MAPSASDLPHALPISYPIVIPSTSMGLLFRAVLSSRSVRRRGVSTQGDRPSLRDNDVVEGSVATPEAR
jgi:hypothetical protein